MTLIQRTTGDATAPFGFRGTDLGYFTKTNHGYVTALFGDTFDQALPQPGNTGWRSPVILRTHNTDIRNGIKWDNAVGGGRAKEVISYTHQSAADAKAREGDGFTQIPNDMIHLPDGRWLLSTFAIRSWDNQGAGDSWLTWANHFWTSTDTHGENWTHAKWADLNGVMKFNQSTPGWDKFQNASLVLWDGYLYMFGTQQGRYKGGGIYLARVKWQDWNKLFAWQFWGWENNQWAWGTKQPSAILHTVNEGGRIGEINAQVIENQIVLAYVDYSISRGAAVTRTAVRPDSVWTNPQIHATQATVPNLYAPSVHPYSTLAQPVMHLSQWNSKIYGSSLHTMSALRSAVPVAPADKTVEGTSMAVCADLSNLTAAQLAEVLTSDTNVSTEDLAAELAKRQ